MTPSRVDHQGWGALCEQPVLGHPPSPDTAAVPAWVGGRVKVVDLLPATPASGTYAWPRNWKCAGGG